ncbi:UNVERIFIED_CONTAM: hypothetical protein GTU68_064539 [Idotea baltica]|nr:hypothetical protein [Idotea baltica]
MSSAIRAYSLYLRSAQSLCSINTQRVGLNYGKRISLQGIGSFRFMSSEFEEAKTRLGKLQEDPGNETKLKIYGLFKQSTEGPVQSKRPGMMDFVARAKWDAWNSNGTISKEEAQKQYIGLVNSLVKSEESVEAGRQESGQKFKNLIIECDGGLRKIILNRPKKFNALTLEMYLEWIEALKDADNDPKTVITAVTGSGTYYCAGNDLSNFTNVTPDKMNQMAVDARATMQKFVAAFIDFKKPLLAVVNGPAIGIPVTTMALYDGVYCTDKATFHTPFSSLGQSPEGCSSITFPRFMGYANAAQLLMFNKKITAEEALRLGVIPTTPSKPRFGPGSRNSPSCLSSLSSTPRSLPEAWTRTLCTRPNDMEGERLQERWVSEDCMNAIMAFFSKKK